MARALADAGIEVEDLSLRQPTLDEVFLTLTGLPILDDDDAPTAPRRSPDDRTTTPSTDRRSRIDVARRRRRPSRTRRGACSTTSWVIARRGLIHMKRQPEQLSDATIQPIMFVLLFAYVFGGAIDVPGGGDATGSS